MAEVGRAQDKLRPGPSSRDLFWEEGNMVPCGGTGRVVGGRGSWQQQGPVATGHFSPSLSGCV